MARARTTPAPASNEADVRLGILNSLLTCPHRKLDQVQPLHSELIAKDPIFYQQLAAWYCDRSGGGATIRDHCEAFVVNLCLSGFAGHRDVGCALLRGMPPYQVERVLDFIRGRKFVRTVKPKIVKSKKSKKGSQLLVGGAAVGSIEAEPIITTGGIAESEPKKEIVKTGLFKAIPETVKTEVQRFLSERERDNDWFDSTVLSARKTMRRLYEFYRFKHGKRANDVVFKKKYPANSKLAVLKELAAAKTPADQAKIIVENKVSFLVATSVVQAMTPTVLLALVEVMTDQQLLNSLGMLKKRGAFDNPELKAAIEARIDGAKKSKKVSALKTQEAVKAAGLEGETKAKVEAVGDAQVKAKGRIKQATCLMVDKSGSQEKTIELGKQIATLISTVMDEGQPFFVYAFDTMPIPIKVPEKKDLASWNKAFSGINATGGTGPGSVVRYMTTAKEKVAQFLIVTDEDENQAPTFADAVKSYQQAMGVEVQVVIVRVKDNYGRTHDGIEKSCKAAGIETAVWSMTDMTDYYSLPGIVPLLCKNTKLDLLMSIMNWPLPERKSA